MNEEIEQEKPEEEKDLTCPECGKGFQDMRGLTSHVRHFHGIQKEELKRNIMKENKNSDTNSLLKFLGGAGAILIAIITAGRIK